MGNNEQVSLVDFSQAEKLAKEIAENQQQSSEEEREESVQQEENNEPTKTETQNQNEPTAEEALKLAEISTNEMAKSKESIDKLQSENEKLKNLLKEISNDRRDKLEDDALNINFDYDELSFMDKDSQKKAFNEYAKTISEYTRQKILESISPLIERSQNAIQSQEETNIIEQMKENEQFQDIEQLAPQIRKIIESNHVLRDGNFTTEEKIVTAYLIAQGAENQNRKSQSGQKMSKEDFFNFMADNPEYDEYINERNLEKIKHNQQVPRFSVQSGAGNSALNIKERPKNFNEAIDFIKKNYK